MIYTALDNFYLTDEELGNSPSRKHDIDEETETTLRIFGCELIQEAGILLKCPQAVMATGQVLFQRFFCRKSMREFNVRRMACACLFLATKLEESHRRTRDILMVFDRINKRRDGSKNVPLLIPETKEYDVMKERVITYERILLKTFGFIIHAVHPHKYVNSFVHSLDGSDELQQLAWNMLNDSLRTTLCVRFKAHVVAAGAIYLAARRLQVPLPQSPPWWEAFKVPTDQLVEVVQNLHSLYQRPKAHYIEVNPDVLKQQQAVSGLGAAKQLTPGLEGNDSPAAQDSSVIRGVPDLASQQQGPPAAGAPVVASTAGPAGANAAADMLAAAVAAAQQRLQGTVLAAGAAATVTAAAATQQQSRQDLDVVSTVQQGPNGPTTTGGAGQANGGGAASALDGGAVQSRKRSRSRSQDKSRKRSRSSSRSPSPSRSRSWDRERDRERSRRSRSRERDRHRDSRREGSRRDRRSRSRDRRDRDRERDHNWDRRDRDREREKERERVDRDRRERDSKADRGRERERERGNEKPTDREARSTVANKDDNRDRRDDGSLPPPPLPPRHPDRHRR
ncbi:hypothetical protein Vretimale_5606 [Volvox reticuliferus]|uniref:Uncharacterized protein n=2 Tax=Volvox reticuliferus TaxID=1737510 RepID=A0A8J4LJX8_9CHLO|nr:hypothetical protein Vretifemale_5643 [Volvox reticuliferus]GIM00674.1 hypothetical protein Vretimale_5606 [Volvox reticuliferus]